jgi:hypothetical protein
MAGYLLLVSLPHHGSLLSVSRQPIQPVPHQHVIDRAGRDFDVMVTLQVLGDTELTEMISAPQVKNLLFNMDGSAQFRVLGARLAVDERSLAISLESLLPLIESLARDTKRAASP